MTDGDRDKLGTQVSQLLQVPFDPFPHCPNPKRSLKPVPIVRWSEGSYCQSYKVHSQENHHFLYRVDMPRNPWCVRNVDGNIRPWNNKGNLPRNKETKQFKSHLNNFSSFPYLHPCLFNESIWIPRACSFSHVGGWVLEMSFHLISSTS